MDAHCETIVTRGSIGGSQWEMASRPPNPALRRYVKSLVGYDEHSLGPQSQRQFPASYVVVIIDFGAPLQVTMGGDPRTTSTNAGGFVAALDDAYAITQHGGRQLGVQVDLTPTGARRLFGLPLSELSGRIVALDDLWPHDHARLCDSLANAENWALRLDLVEKEIGHRILASHLDSALVDWAVGQIETQYDTLKIGSLSKEIGCSPRHLISRFRDQVGVPPKQLARLVRFGRVTDDFRAAPNLRLSELAANHGFSDQAHLARDVKHFTGLTATEAAESFSELADLFG